MKPEYIFLIALVITRLLTIISGLIIIHYIRSIIRQDEETEHNPLSMCSSRQSDEMIKDRSDILKEIKSAEETIKNYSKSACYAPPDKDYN